MADDPPEHDRPEGVTVPVRRSLPSFTAQPQFAPSGEYHQFPETIAGHSPVVINATPVSSKPYGGLFLSRMVVFTLLDLVVVNAL